MYLTSVNVPNKNHIKTLRNTENSWLLEECWYPFQILIPPSYGNSFLVLSNFAVCHYKQTEYYKGMKKQFSYNYKDPKFNLKLTCAKPILSDRDKNSKFI